MEVGINQIIIYILPTIIRNPSSKSLQMWQQSIHLPLSPAKVLSRNYHRSHNNHPPLMPGWRARTNICIYKQGHHQSTYINIQTTSQLNYTMYKNEHKNITYTYQLVPKPGQEVEASQGLHGSPYPHTGTPQSLQEAGTTTPIAP